MPQNPLAHSIHDTLRPHKITLNAGYLMHCNNPDRPFSMPIQMLHAHPSELRSPAAHLPASLSTFRSSPVQSKFPRTITALGLRFCPTYALPRPCPHLYPTL